MKGDGRVFRRGRIWWIAYFGSVPGEKEIRESSRSRDERAARRLLLRRLEKIETARAGEGIFISPDHLRRPFEELLDKLEAALKLWGRKSYRTATYQLKHARRFFAGRRAGEVTGARIRDYQEFRRSRNAAKATVDRECELIRRAFTLARDDGSMVRVPKVVPLLKKDENARRVLIRPLEFFALLDLISDEGFRDWIEFFWLTAMRNSETSSLTWEDLENGNPPVLTLRAENSKTGEERAIPVVGPLLPIFRRRVAARRLDCPYIFHSEGRGFLTPNGGLPNRFYSLWKSACNAIGRPELRVYDLRRSAMRNLRDAGVPQEDVMKISGHETDESYRRYSVRNLDDKVQAFERVGKYLEASKSETSDLPTFFPGQNPGRPAEKNRKS